MKRFVIAIACTCISLACSAQTIFVRDANNGRPVQGVVLSSKNPEASATTNEFGQADISALRGSDSILIRHFGYNVFIVSYAFLETKQFQISLSELSVTLKEVIVESGRWRDLSLETPTRIERMNMQDAAFQNPQTAADLLGTSGYVFIQKSQLGGGSPMLRGFATNRVLLVVDGVRMNTAIFRAGNLQNVISLDANALQGVDVVFGAGSVVYGSDAIGGVMDFRTLVPRFADSASKKPIVTGNVLMRSSSANSEKSGHFDFNTAFKKWAFTTSFTSSEYGDLRSGSKGGDPYFYRPYYVETIDNKDYMVKNNDSTLQVGTNFSQINFMQKVSFKANNSLVFDYGFHFSETSKFNRYDRLYIMQTSGPYKNKLRWAEWFYGPQKWTMHRFGITLDKATRIYDKAQVIFAAQYFEESRNVREFMFRELLMQKENVKALSLNVDFEKRISPRLSVNYGVEAVHNLVTSLATLTHVITLEEEPIVTRYPDGSTWESYSAFATGKYQLTEKIVLNSGVRYNYYRIKASFDTTFFPFPFTNTVMQNGSISGSLGFVYSPNKTMQGYLNFASGFRAPNIDDMGKVFESTPGYLVVPNPNLKPETVYNFEVGAVKTFGKYLRIDFAAYYTFLFDGMIRKNFTFNGDTTIRYLGNKSRIQAVQNVSEIHVYGIQGGIEFNYKGFGITSNISYQSGKEQSPDSLIFYPLRHAAPLFGTTHFTYRYKTLKFDFYLIYNGRMDFEDLAITERLNASYAKNELGQNYASSWYTLNLKAGYFINEYLGINIGVENLLDKMYRPYSSGLNAPGRNFIVALRGRF